MAKYEHESAWKDPNKKPRNPLERRVLKRERAHDADTLAGYKRSNRQPPTDPYEVSTHYKYLNSKDKKHYSEEDKERHAWHRANEAGFRVADAIKKSFGPDAQQSSQASEHSFSPDYLKEWADAEQAATLIPHAISDEASYTFIVTHVPSNDSNGPIDKLTLTAKPKQQAGSTQAWECSLSIAHGKVSYAKDIAHQITTVTSGSNSGEISTRNAKLDDIQALSRLLKEARQLPFKFPPPLKP